MTDWSSSGQRFPSQNLDGRRGQLLRQSEPLNYTGSGIALLFQTVYGCTILKYIYKHIII